MTYIPGAKLLVAVLRSEKEKILRGECARTGESLEEPNLRLSLKLLHLLNELVTELLYWNGTFRFSSDFLDVLLRRWTTLLKREEEEEGFLLVVVVWELSNSSVLKNSSRTPVGEDESETFIIWELRGRWQKRFLNLDRHIHHLIWNFKRPFSV